MARPEATLTGFGNSAGSAVVPDVHGSVVRVACDASVLEAAAALRAGHLIGLPTETVYGLAADANNPQAVEAIFRAKGRPNDHPLIVHVASLESAAQWVEITTDIRMLMKAFWPGPLTLIVPRRASAAPFASAGQTSVGLRCPSHPVAQQVLRAFEASGASGVAAPSANRFGRISPTRADDVVDELGDSLEMILDGGSADIGLESTIVDLTCSPVSVRRPGAISPEAIATILNRPVDRAWLDAATRDRLAPVSGSLAAHYAPQTPMQLIDAHVLDTVLACRDASACAVWSEREPASNVKLWLPWHADPERVARLLYSSLRQLDRCGAQAILVQAPAQSPAWDAVRDRLQRAAVGSRA